MAYPDELHLTSRQNFIDWARVSSVNASIESQIDTLIERASAFIMLQISREKYLNSGSDITERYSGDNSSVLFPRMTPIASITSLKVNDIAIPASNTYGSHGYRFDPDCIELTNDYFYEGRSNVELIYQGGVASSSYEFKALEQGVLEMMSKKWSRRDHSDHLVHHAGTQIIARFKEDDIPAETWLVIKRLRRTIPIL